MVIDWRELLKCGTLGQPCNHEAPSFQTPELESTNPAIRKKSEKNPIIRKLFFKKNQPCHQKKSLGKPCNQEAPSFQNPTIEKYQVSPAIRKHQVNPVIRKHQVFEPRN